MIAASDEHYGGGEESFGTQFEQVQSTQSTLPEYKVYRRRWAGLAVLMGMNIVTSWGVRQFSCLLSEDLTNI